MTHIAPGDWVECLMDGRYGIFRKGAIYHVRDVKRGLNCNFCGPDCFGLVFHSVADPAPGGFWVGCKFRPIYRPKRYLTHAAFFKERVGSV